MTTILAHAGQALLFLLWVALWLVGGWWLARRSFSLSDNENWLIGTVVGLTVQVWLANLLSKVIPVPQSFWLSAGIVFLAGFFSWYPFRGNWKEMFKVKVSIGLILVFLSSIYLFFVIGRGLGIADDYQNLPLTSLIATGNIPPHFPLNPNIRFGYHYFLLLVAGQMSRLIGMAPWIALDLARSLSIVIAIFLAGLLGNRMTRNKLVGFISAVFVAFCMGTRWLLLFLPPTIVQSISHSITMIGSGIESAPDFATALIGVWANSGSGPIGFPFAFVSGVNNPIVMMLSGIGASQVCIILSLLLTFKRWNGWKGAVLTAIFLASMGLIAEIAVVLSIIAWAIMAFLVLLRYRTFKIPAKFWTWIVVSFTAIIFVSFQGGVISEIVYRVFHPGVNIGSYFVDFDFQPILPPAIVSSHLGILKLTNPSQLFIALLEIGPVILTLPLFVVFLIRSLRASRWFESNLLIASLLSLGSIFFLTGGTVGVSGTTRFYVELLTPLKIFTIPLLYLWVKSKNISIKIGTCLLLGASMVSGIILFGIESTAAQKPVITDFINELDGKVYEKYWNNLEIGSLVFDPKPSRAPTLLGRLTYSSDSWYMQLPEWKTLASTADPYALHKFGFDYAYIDSDYWKGLPPANQDLFNDDCIILMDEFSQPDPRDLTKIEFRRLLDIRGCTK